MQERLMAISLGAIAGAALTFFLDPRRGARRRAYILEKFNKVGHSLPKELNREIRDLGHRGKGLLASSRSVLRNEGTPDEVLVARVRSALGRVTINPHAISVEARDGRITLRGKVLAKEVEHVKHCVQRVRGVRSVHNQLQTVRDGETELQSLQRYRGRQRSQRRFRWPALAGIAAAGLGGAATMAGARRSSLG